jgi:ubiquinone/menaquinone biosynthesis C-methylase UbiE/uncharacterized protein YbaR (Trm112 family)
LKREFVDDIHCPWCRGLGLSLLVQEENGQEVREGELRCKCGSTFPIHKGIPDFLDPDDEVLASEIKGWIHLAGPLHEGLVPVMTALPCFPHEPWPHVAPDFFQIFEHVDFSGRRVVDLGAGRTWSSRFLKTLGRAAEVVAVDVLTTRFLGLETADIFLEMDGIHFERLRGDAHRLPLADGWADAVFSCAAIHHSSDIDRLFAEVWRVLRPGGRLVFVSEACKKESIPGNKPRNVEVEAGINENFYSLAEYQAALRKHGFRCRRIAPRTVRYRLLYPDRDFLSGAPGFLRRLARRRWGRELIYRLLRSRIAGEWVYRYWSLPLSMIATKPR